MFYWRDSLTQKLQLGLVHAAEGEGGGGEGGASSNGDKGGENWYSSLPENVQGWDEVKNSDSPEKFFKQMGDMRSHIGQSIRIPSEDAGEEDWKAFHEKIQAKVPGLIDAPNPEDAEALGRLYGSLGKPEKSDGYTVPEVEGADMSQAEAMRDIAHKYHLTDAQFAGIASEMAQANLLANEAALADVKAGHEELQKEWGQDYNRRMSLGLNIAKLTDAPPDLIKMFENGHANAESAKWLYNLASKFKGEGANLLKDENSRKPKMTPEEAAKRITDIQNNKEHPYWKKSAPGHKAAMKKMAELYEAKMAG